MSRREFQITYVFFTGENQMKAGRRHGKAAVNQSGLELEMAAVLSEIRVGRGESLPKEPLLKRSLARKPVEPSGKCGKAF